MPAPTAAFGATGSRSCTLLAAKLLVDRDRGREQRAHQEGLALENPDCETNRRASKPSSGSLDQGAEDSRRSRLGLITETQRADFLQDAAELRRWREAHSSIRIQEGEPS